jgi:heat shock protein 4
VSFGPKQRFIGEPAKTQEVSNFKNTVSSLKRLAGRTFQDQEIQEIEKQYINAELVDVHGQVGVKVRHIAHSLYHLSVAH